MTDTSKVQPYGRGPPGTSIADQRGKKRIILVDPDAEACDLLATRLQAQDFVVDTASDAATGAERALACPPDALIADLWMPSISGVQLCRLLRAEPATVDVPVVLRAREDTPRSRFWAERAGASAFVSKGRMGELARALRALTDRPATDGFFMQVPSGSVDIRDRIAVHLDAALFESVIAAEVRALASACTFDRLFDAFTQLATRLLTYRWLAISTIAPSRLAVHSHPHLADEAEAEARAALGIDAAPAVFQVRDADASDQPAATTIVHDVTFGNALVGRIAVASIAPDDDGLSRLVESFGRELGGAVQMATLVEQSHRLATTDPLTGLLSRRAFIDVMRIELERSDRYGAPLAALLLDIDHFKAINDQHGHGTGDAVLAAVGKLLTHAARSSDAVARWGGEEFVALLPTAGLEDALKVGERYRTAIEQLTVRSAREQSVRFTGSIGVAVRLPGEPLEALLERADQAMYSAKTTGRNRVCAARHLTVAPPSSIHGPSSSVTEPPMASGAGC